MHLDAIYALKVLKSHENLRDIAKATLVRKLLYTSPVWLGFADSEARIRLQSALQKRIQFVFLPKNHPPVDLLCETADGS